MKCTWQDLQPDGSVKVCGRDAVVEFSREVADMGRLLRQRFPRCKKHSSKSTREWAAANDWDIEYLTEEA